MNIDLRTLSFLLGLISVLQIVVFFIQYIIFKKSQSIGWWLLWSLLTALGIICMLMRDVLSTGLIPLSIIFTNILFVLGQIALNVGIMRFLGRKEHGLLLVSLFTVFLASTLYAIYGNRDDTMRVIVLYISFAVITYMSAQALHAYKTPSITASAAFLAAVFLAFGSYYTFSTAAAFSILPIDDVFTSTLAQMVTLMVSIVSTLLWSFGLIIMSNQQTTAHYIESEGKYRNLVDNSQSIIYTLTADGTITFVSASWKTLLGHEPEEIVGGSFIPLVHEDDVQACAELLRRTAETGTVQPGEEYRVFHKNGSIRWHRSVITPFFDEHQNLTIFVGNAVDISERKQAEETLRESEEKYRLLHESAGVGIGYYTTSGDVISYNTVAAQNMGGKPEDFNGKSIYELFPKMAADFYMGRIQKATALEGIQTYEDFVDLPNEQKWFVSSFTRILNSINKVIGVQIISTEISELKRAEKAQSESEEKLRALFSSMTEMVALHELVFDEEGKPVDYRITDCNTAYTEITGILREKAIGRLATEVYQTETPPYLEEYSRVALSGVPYQFETYFAPMEKHFSISVVSPGKNKFATITTDITALKQAEQYITAKNKELEQIIYIASHDLRSPLVNVDGYSRELEYTVEEFKVALDAAHPNDIEASLRTSLPDMCSALLHIRNSTRQMDTLIKGLLKLSRSGRAALIITPLNMNELIARLVSNMEFQTREAGVELHITELPPCKGDAVQLMQVFSNLIDNALKYMNAQRAGVITVSGTIEKERSVYCVEDNGIGIAVLHQEKIFELFHRLDPSKSEGEGLGLTIVRQILERLDGNIRVESKPDQGSRFYVSLPCTHL